MDFNEELGIILFYEERENLNKSVLVDSRIRFGREDANLIIEGYRKPSEENCDEYVCRRRHKKDVNFYSSKLRNCEPILVSKKENIWDKPLEDFIEDYFPDDLKKKFLNKPPFILMHIFTDPLLNHKCDSKDTCIKHLRLLMKLSITLRTATCIDFICRELRHFNSFDLGSNLKINYFIKFVIGIDLIYFFMNQRYIDATEFLDKTAAHLMPYFINIFEPYTHLCVAWKFGYLLKLLLKYGARNLDKHPAYEFYTEREFFDESDFRREGKPGRSWYGLLINSRIQMRVLQVFIWNRFGSKRAMRMLQLSHLEPYITKQEYEDTFDGFYTPIDISAEQKKNFKRESWNWYKGLFEIKDGAPVTPRSLQDVCRYVIRHNLSRNRKLPHGVKDLYDGENPWEDYLNEEDSKFHLIAFNKLIQDQTK